MGYRGKLEEQNRARELRAEAWTLADIAAELGVSKSSVSLWVRDVDFDQAAVNARTVERKAAAARRRGPNKLQRRKQAEIERLLIEGRERIATLTERDFLVAGTMLYAGEGAKGDGKVKMTNCDPRLIDFFCRWFRHFFDIDESRLRVRLYLHEGLDLEAANQFWSQLTAIPPSQFGAPYRAEPKPSIRKAKHIYGCPAVSYSCCRTHRAIMGLVHALVSSKALPG